MKEMSEESISKVRRYSAYFSVLFFIQFFITLIILTSDQNLQTDFGTVGKYFIHWYGLLVSGIVDAVAFGILIFTGRKLFIGLGVIWGTFMAIFQVADILTASSLNVGLTESQFATYLFGLSKYPGALPYIPGLYDLLFAIYILIIIVGILFYRMSGKAS